MDETLYWDKDVIPWVWPWGAIYDFILLLGEEIFRLGMWEAQWRMGEWYNTGLYRGLVWRELVQECEEWDNYFWEVVEIEEELKEEVEEEDLRSVIYDDLCNCGMITDMRLECSNRATVGDLGGLVLEE
jgi:hypothetical protein